MDKHYAETARLLLQIATEVFVSDRFAMKGGTAINLFVQDMPRLSVDIDVVYLPWQTPREQALHEINQELAAISQRINTLGVHTRLIDSKNLGETKLIAENETAQVKVEVNTVFRGAVLPTTRRRLSRKVGDLFGVEFEVPVLAPDELYAGKLVAALDRQHPRDLFDVWQLFQTTGITEQMVECFVVYLAGHNRTVHDVLFPHEKPIAEEYERAFAGMPQIDCPLEALLETRTRLFHELPQRLTQTHRKFLNGLVRAQPDWSLLQCPHAGELPALRWKLENLKLFRKRRPKEFLKQAEMLETALSSGTSG